MIVPPWYDLPGYMLFVIALIALALRDRELATAALILCADYVLTNWITGWIAADSQWACKAILDLATGAALAWPMRRTGVIMAALLGINVSGYLVIGASQAFGNAYVQAYIAYYAWWTMEYLAFAICGVLALLGFDDHGGKPIRAYLARHLGGDRHHFLESHRQNR